MSKKITKTKQAIKFKLFPNEQYDQQREKHRAYLKAGLELEKQIQKSDGTIIRTYGKPTTGALMPNPNPKTKQGWEKLKKEYHIAIHECKPIEWYENYWIPKVEELLSSQKKEVLSEVAREIEKYFIEKNYHTGTLYEGLKALLSKIKKLKKENEKS